MNSSTQKHTATPEILRKTLALAETWQNRANSLRTREELAHQRMMRRMLQHPSDKTVLTHFIDQSSCSQNPLRDHDRVPEEMHKIAAKLGKHISRNVPLAEGLIEMLRYLRDKAFQQIITAMVI